MLVEEVDPNPEWIFLSKYSTLDIGPLYHCSPEMAIQQCCWLECGYWVIDYREKKDRDWEVKYAAAFFQFC